MDLKQEPFDPHEEAIKIEPYSISGHSQETDIPKPLETFGNHQLGMVCDTITQTTHCTVNMFEPPAYIGKIKPEIIELKVPKIEECSNLSIKTEQDFCEKVQSFPSEFCNIREVKAADMFVDIKDIKREITDYVQIKTESELLTTQCDLPTLKDESVVYPDYFEQSCSSKQAYRTLKPLKNNIKKKRRYPCPICQKSCPSSKSRQNHIDRHFGKRPVHSSRSSLSRKKYFNTPFGKYNETCRYCHQFSFNKTQFLSHFYVSHYVKLDVNKKRKCLLKRHTNEKSFKCEICSRTLRTKRNLNNHLKRHTGEKPYQCKLCLKQFSQKSNLTAHMKIHTNEKPYECEVCFKQFRSSSNLCGHRKIHIAAKSYECEICSKQFAQWPYLKRHIDTHSESKKSKKPYGCDECSASFKEKYRLVRHLKSHTCAKPFKCEFCLKAYTSNYYLTLHAKIHSDTQTFICHICSAKFVLKHHLNDHVKSHTGEKPFECEICSKRFISKSKLRRHTKVHFKENQ